MNNIKSRAKKPLDLKYFNGGRLQPEYIKPMPDIYPRGGFNILRMPIRTQNGDFTYSNKLLWVKPLIELACSAQEKYSIKHPFVYLTIRTGMGTADLNEWHVDGYSERYTHLPEQNYIWCSDIPTQYISLFDAEFPQDFDPMVHNINKYLEKQIYEWNIRTIKEKTLYCLDPYVLHRQPIVTNPTRTFIRISFTPIEIQDRNNTYNPSIPRQSHYDGRNFRNQLIEY